MQSMSTSSIDLIVTSPPYNLNKKYGTYKDRKSIDQYVDFSRAWMTEAARLLTPAASLWINVGNMRDTDGGNLPIDYLIHPIGKELDLSFRQRITWHHHTGKPQVSKFTQITECWLWFTKVPKGFTWNLDDVRVPHRHTAGGKKMDKRCNPIGRNPTDLWNFPSYPHNAKTRPNHPCPFPIPMIERIVRACSNPGEVVLDPFSGSGQTVLAAMATDRHGIGIELDPTFHELANSRVAEVRQ